MRIKTLAIKNYRSFNNDGCVINLPDIPHPIAITGYNNCGKTNVLEAMRLVCGDKDYGQKFSKDDHHNQDVSEKIQIDSQFSHPIGIPSIYKNDTSDKLCCGARYEVAINSEYTIRHYALGADGKILVKQEKMGERSLPVQFPPYKNKLNFFYINSRNLEKHLKITPYSLLGLVMRDIKKDFKSEQNIYTDKNGERPRYEVYKQIVKVVEDKILNTEKLQQFLKSVESKIVEQLNLKNDNLKIEYKLPDADSIYDSMTFRLADNDKKPPLPLDNLGDGFQSILIIAILQVLIETHVGGKIIVLEEPEAFLHEHFQEYFYKLLCDLAKNNQVIYTTHSKKFVNIFEPDSIIKVNSVDYVSSSIVQNKDYILTPPVDIGGFTLDSVADFSKYMITLEPNIGNIIFASKVVIVEGPHDLFAYKLVLSQEVNLGLENIAVVSAGGKDPVSIIIQLCQCYQIPYFVIHDWDLDQNINDSLQKPNENNSVYMQLSSTDKAQYTKNYKIQQLAGIANVHRNKRNIEEALGIAIKNKSTEYIYKQLHGKTWNKIKEDYPGFLPDMLLSFVSSK